MKPATWWWLENTSQGRRTQRRMLPESALGPRARAEAREERAEAERRRCLLARGHKGRCVAATRRPITDRMKAGEFRESHPEGLAVPGVSAPARAPRCGRIA